MRNLRKAKVRATGKEIEVYHLEKGGWCDYSDCKTEYKDSDLIFLD